MKKGLVYLLVFAFLCGLCTYGIDYTVGKQIENRSPYYLSFASIGAISLESRMDSWAKLRTSSSREELVDYMHNVTRTLGLPNDAQNYQYQTDPQSLQIQYEVRQDLYNYCITLKSNYEENQTYLIVEVITSEPNVNLEAIAAKLEQIIGLKWTSYYLYTGTLEQVVNESNHLELLDVVMKNMDARMVENFHDNRSSSATGYSRNLKVPAIVTGTGKKYNIQVALRSVPVEKKTYVYIGTPLIIGNY